MAKYTDIELMIIKRGKTIKQVAADTGRSENAIAQKARLMGVRFRKYGDNNHSTKHSNHDVELVRLLDESGMDRCIISEKMDIPASTVSSICNFNHRTKG